MMVVPGVVFFYSLELLGAGGTRAVTRRLNRLPTDVTARPSTAGQDPSAIAQW